MRSRPDVYGTVISRNVSFAKYHVAQCKEVGGEKRIIERQDRSKICGISHTRLAIFLHNIGRNTGAKRNTGYTFTFAMCLLVYPAMHNWNS